MNENLAFLQQRNSAPRLAEPAPDDAQLQEMVKAALRAPDHAWLKPWRCLTLRGERREALGVELERRLLARNPEADEAARNKARNSPLRAPLLLVVVTRLSEHPKVPHSEQRLAAGCAAQSLLLAAEALGFAGIWRTGDAAFDPLIMSALGLGPDEEIAGFLYLGTRAGPCKPVPPLDPADFLRPW